MIFALLAEVAVQPENETLKAVLGVLGWVTSFTVAILGALHLKSVKATSRAEGKAEAVHVGPQPFIIQLREEFATRRELEKLELTMNSHVAEMKAAGISTSNEMKVLFRETMAAMATQTESTTKMIERRHKTLSEEIAKVASGAYAGRQKIWEQVNSQREDLAGLKATKDMGVQIGKLADALAPQTKVQPTHSANS